MVTSTARGSGLGDREENLQRLGSEQFDLVVIGGGITGAGVALDAASRGIKVALVEQDDFASGTSSRSSKLVHGGLRYVAQYQFRVTRESSEERYHLQRLAAPLVRSVPFLLPVYGGVRETTKVSAGLWLYDVLAVLRNTRLHRHLTAADVHALVPSLATDGLDGGFVYYDCRTDDARLTIEVLKAAVHYGAVIVNHTSAERFLRGDDRITGVGVVDRLGHGSREIRARTVVAAAGVWLDSLRPLADRQEQPITRPAKGVHLIFPEPRIGHGETALTLQTARDHRITFVIPWMNRTLVGTTDTDYSGDLAEPRATAADVDYLLEAVQQAFPGQHIGRNDIIAVQAGLRPLINDPNASTAAISRADRVLEGDSGLISIAGGKLTTYRRMAKKVVDLVAKRLAERHGTLVGPCKTGSIAIGGDDGNDDSLDRLPEPISANLLELYAHHANDVARLAIDDARLAMPLVADLPHIAAQVVYAARNEMALTLSDVLIRRLRIATTARDFGHECLPATVALIGDTLGWNEQERIDQVAHYRREVQQFAVPGRADRVETTASTATRLAPP